MATEKDYQGLYDRIAALREQVTDRLSADLSANPELADARPHILAPDLVSNPHLADALTKQIDDLLASVVDADGKVPPPPDKGLAALVGVGPDAANQFGTTRVPPGVEA